jgi:hypothetical protein
MHVSIYTLRTKVWVITILVTSQSYENLGDIRYLSENNVTLSYVNTTIKDRIYTGRTIF